MTRSRRLTRFPEVGQARAAPEQLRIVNRFWGGHNPLAARTTVREWAENADFPRSDVFLHAVRASRHGGMTIHAAFDPQPRTGDANILAQIKGTGDVQRRPPFVENDALIAEG